MRTSTEKKLVRVIVVIVATIAYAPFALATDPPVCTSPGVPAGCKPAKPVDQPRAPAPQPK